MENFNDLKIELLSNIEKLVNAINREIDWFIASRNEKDSLKRSIAKTIFKQKHLETAQLAREAYERFK